MSEVFCSMLLRYAFHSQFIFLVVGKSSPNTGSSGKVDGKKCFCDIYNVTSK